MSQRTRKELLQRIKELEYECHQLKQGAKEQISVEKYMLEILDNTPAPIYLKDSQGSYLFINKKYEELAHVTMAEILGKSDYDIFPEPVAALFRAQDDEVIQKGLPCEFEETIPLKDGIHTYITSKFPLHGKDGVINAVGGFCTDITERKKAEGELNEYRNHLEKLVVDRTKKLKRKTLRLEEINVALKVLLQKREKDKKEIEKNIINNIERLVYPYIEKLKGINQKSEGSAYLDVIEFNLKEITSLFSPNLLGRLSKLTVTEIQVADLIRRGKATKEIAELLKLSPATIATHRQNIRKKLELTNKKLNLQTTLAANQN